MLISINHRNSNNNYNTKNKNYNKNNNKNKNNIFVNIIPIHDTYLYLFLEIIDSKNLELYLE